MRSSTLIRRVTIHRDIKPSNVLIALRDGKPVPKVIDFGLAKVIGQSLTEEWTSTKEEQNDGTPKVPPVLGTLEYLSPEQTDPAKSIDTQSDIYTLGTLLYELLTGTTPFDRKRLKNSGNKEAFRIICEETPPKPSDRLKALKELRPDSAGKRGTKPEKLLQQFQEDLDLIVMKALEKEPAKRYASAAALASDIMRYLAGDSVEARVARSTWYVLKKLHRKHPRALPTAVAFVLLLVTGTIISTIFAVRASENARRAYAAEVEAQKAAETARKFTMIVESILLQNPNRSAEGKGGTSLREPLIGNLREAKELMEWWISQDRLTGARFGATLGSALYGLGQAQEAIEVLEKTLAILEVERGCDDLETLAVMNRLAASYFHESDWKKALWLAERTFERRRARLGLDDADTLESLNLLAVSYYHSGQKDRAVSLLEQGFERAKSALAFYDHRKLGLQMDLSLVFRDRGEPGKAVSLLEESFEETLHKLGPQTITFQLILNLADSYIESGRADKVIMELGAGQMDSWKTMLGSDHPWTLKFLSRLIEAYQDANQFDKGDHLLQEWLQDVRVRAGSESLPTAVLLFLRGDNLLKQKKFAEGEPFVRECQAVLERKYPTEWYIPVVRTALGEAMLGQKMDNEAECLLVKGYDGMEATERKLALYEKVRLKRNLVKTIARLVQSYEALGQKDKADSWRKKLAERKALRKQPQS